MQSARTARRQWRRMACRVLVSVVLVAFGGRSGCTGMPESHGGRDDPYLDARRRMVREQIEGRGVRDPAVLGAMGRVARHLFVPEDLRPRAYDDFPLPIGERQTISQPYIVAFMTEAIEPRSTDRVLEIGTGSGYQAAVLASIVAEVFSVEILPDLADSARRRLAGMGYANVTVRTGDGYHGWPGEAPFDAIIVTAAPGEVPAPLIEQLKVGGRLVIPIGSEDQRLIRLRRTADGVQRETLLPVRFVPMTGAAQRPI